MQPFTNPNYFYPNQQFMPQQINYPQVTSGINGRVVDSFDNISVNEVPMTGISVFPKTDLSEVVVKKWTPNGTIQTLRFKAFLDDLAPQTTNVSTDEEKSLYDNARVAIQGLNDTLAEINSKIDKLMPSTSKKGATNEPKSNS